VRGVRLEVARLDDIAGDLICEATRVAGDQDSVVYEFAIRAAKNQIGYSARGTDIATLLSGRATIALQDAKRP
jgi:predicted hotdog family 3-hydroxylacyl-ACP dehydratase